VQQLSAEFAELVTKKEHKSANSITTLEVTTSSLQLNHASCSTLDSDTPEVEMTLEKHTHDPANAPGSESLISVIEQALAAPATTAARAPATDEYYYDDELFPAVIKKRKVSAAQEHDS
jgi:hypothetical protein